MNSNADVTKLIAFGQMALEQGWYEQAREHFEQALALDPSNREAMKGRARANELLSRRAATAARPIQAEPVKPLPEVERRRSPPERKREEPGKSLIRWFKNQSTKRKVAILAITPLLFLCFCSSLAQVISPTPEPTVTPISTKTEIITTPLLPTNTPIPPDTPLPTSTQIPPTMTPIPVGLNRLNPIPVGQSIVADNDIELTVLDWQRDAWPQIHEYNMFNPEPSEGMEYIIVVLRVKNLGDPADTKGISSWDFRIVGDRGTIYDSPSLVLDNQLGAELFGGGITEGQLAFEVSQGEANLVLIYDSGLDTNARYLSVGQ